MRPVSPTSTSSCCSWLKKKYINRQTSPWKQILVKNRLGITIPCGSKGMNHLVSVKITWICVVKPQMEVYRKIHILTVSFPVTDIPSDNVYAYALSKTLTKVSSPVTVGLYSECHNRINMVLKNIEGKCAHLSNNFKWSQMSPRCPPKFLDILTFLTLYLLFFLSSYE